MTDELASSLTDVVLAAVTAALGASLAARPRHRAWGATFLALALAAALGALYHAVGALHTDAAWRVVSAVAATTGPLFLASCLRSSGAPGRTLLLFASVGLVVGALLATGPFWRVTAFDAACMFAGLVMVHRSPARGARPWLYAGAGVLVAAAAVQTVNVGHGLLSGNSLFHLTQTLANVLVWKGARRT